MMIALDYLKLYWMYIVGSLIILLIIIFIIGRGFKKADRKAKDLVYQGADMSELKEIVETEMKSNGLQVKKGNKRIEQIKTGDIYLLKEDSVDRKINELKDALKEQIKKEMIEKLFK